MNKPKSWHTCMECGPKFFPNYDPKKYAGGITIMCNQICPDCGAKGVDLIPNSDWDGKGD